MQKPLANQIFYKFIGTWKLIKCIEINSQGNQFYPWGEDAIGYISYSPAGIMAVQIMRRNRKLPNEKDITKEKFEQEYEIEKDYSAYFGPFEIDETNTTVIHIVEGHLNPSMIGKKNIRTYNFYDDILSLTTVGDIVPRNLIWQKVIPLI